MKTIGDLANDMRTDVELREWIVVYLATLQPGDWPRLIAKIADRGYQVTQDDLLAKVQAIHQPGASNADFTGAWRGQ